MCVLRAAMGIFDESAKLSNEVLTAYYSFFGLSWNTALLLFKTSLPLFLNLRFPGYLGRQQSAKDGSIAVLAQEYAVSTGAYLLEDASHPNFDGCHN